MSLTSFLLKDTNQVIFYDSHSHSMFNKDAELLSLPPEHTQEWYTEIANTYGVTHKTDKPKILRILLGQACNYDCGYCMQKDIGNLHEKPESFHIETFMKDIKDNLDLSLVERVELWGGEPFLYWNDIVPLMKLFDKPNISFFISTNGSPLVQKHVDFFKSLSARIEIAISHDGPGQEKLRGEDILKKSKKVEIIKQFYELNPKISFSFNSVISATNYDLFAIDRYFSDFAKANDMPNIKITFIPIRNYDDTNSQNSALHVIQGDDLEKFDKIVNAYINQHIHELLTNTQTMLHSSIIVGPMGVFECVKSLKHQIPITSTSRCGADCSNIVSVDIQSNIKLCPHTHNKFDAGKLNNIKNVNIVKLDLDRKNSHCYHCPVKRICKSSCPIKLPNEVFLMNCAIEKIWYGNIQKGAFRLLFNQEVEMLEVNTDFS